MPFPNQVFRISGLTHKQPPFEKMVIKLSSKHLHARLPSRPVMDHNSG